MKFRLIPIVLVLLLCSTNAYCDSKRDKVLLYFEAYGFMESIEQNAILGIAEMKRANPNLPIEFWESKEYLESIDWWKSEFLNSQVNAAEENIAEEELDALIAFMDTEMGRKTVEINKRMQPIYNVENAKVLGAFSDKFSTIVQKWILKSE